MTNYADVPGWSGYRVSDDGKVMGRQGRIRKLMLDRSGYPVVGLGDPRGFFKLCKVHRLVVSAFIGPIPEGMQVNHKNGVRTDNRLENLEVVTPQQNTRHGWGVLNRKPSYHKRLSGSEHPNAKLTEKDVREIRRLHGSGVTQVELAKRYKLKQPTVSAIVLLKAWKEVV